MAQSELAAVAIIQLDVSGEVVVRQTIVVDGDGLVIFHEIDVDHPILHRELDVARHIVVAAPVVVVVVVVVVVLLPV